MIIYIEDLLREINILNWYRGEAAKRAEPNAVVVQSDSDNQDVMLYYIRTAVVDILVLNKRSRVEFSCQRNDDYIRFRLSPIREDKSYLLETLKEAIRQYIVYEVRRLWMMTVRPEWADATLRNNLRMNINDLLSALADRGKIVRRRAATMGI